MTGACPKQDIDNFLSMEIRTQEAGKKKLAGRRELSKKRPFALSPSKGEPRTNGVRNL